MPTWKTTIGTTSRMLFQSFNKYSGDFIRPVMYCWSVTLSGMNLRLTVFETKPPSVVEKTMP